MATLVPSADIRAFIHKYDQLRVKQLYRSLLICIKRDQRTIAEEVTQ